MDTGKASFFLLLCHLYCSIVNSLRYLAPQTELRPHQLEHLRHVALIKQEILRHLGITDTPRKHLMTHKSKLNHDAINRETEYKITDITSYHSEPPGQYYVYNV